MPQKAPKQDQQFKSLNENKTADSQKLIDAICEGLLDKKAEDIKILDVHKLTTLAEQLHHLPCHHRCANKGNRRADVVKVTREQAG
ncbi:MAG: hypothetical protein U5K69_04100 [Balneolaceae bacterium]|nr:hypothetical protein [Balneolaceae bacterium]